MATGESPGKSPGKIRVVAVDDHPVMLLGISEAARAAAVPVSVIATSRTVDGLDVAEGQADVALLDLRLSDGSRPKENVVRLIDLGMACLVFTDRSHLPLMSEAVTAGARGIVLKHQSAAELLEAVCAVGNGSSFLPVELAEMLARASSSRPHLTDREVEVLGLLFEGLVTKQVARKLELQESTVKEHLKRIRGKYAALGRPVSTRVELIQRAMEDGYVDR
jgi:DNA-binding NarL/FixJ family response regulator